MAMPQTLDALGLKYGTDKASKQHDYLRFYESFFASLQNSNLAVLEIGVAMGASLRTWEEYFPNSRIIGADIVPSAKKYEKNRVVIELLDQSNVEELTRVAVKHGPFDIIIEDGSHMWEHQITSLRTLFPFVKDEGLYVVEDLQTNYGALEKNFRGVASSSCVEYLKSWTDLLVGDDQVPIDRVEDAFLRTYGRAAQFIAFYRRACLIKKQYRPRSSNPVPPQENNGPPLVAKRADEVSLPVRVLAHVGWEGDVVSSSGLINPVTEGHTIQGISFGTEGNLLQYRVRGQSGEWSDWAMNEEFVGTRGQAKALTGITVRLRADTKSRYELRLYGRFEKDAETVEVADGQDCISRTGGALFALQVVLAQS